MTREPRDLVLGDDLRGLLHLYRSAVAKEAAPPMALASLSDVEAALGARLSDAALAIVACQAGVFSEYLCDLAALVPLTEQARARPRHAIRPGRVVIGAHPDGHCWKLAAADGSSMLYDHDLFDGAETPLTPEQLVRDQLELFEALRWDAPLPVAPAEFRVSLA